MFSARSGGPAGGNDSIGQRQRPVEPLGADRDLLPGRRVPGRVGERAERAELGRRATVGPVGLAATELRALRAIADTAVYTSARQEIAIRAEGLDGALALAGAIVAARRAA